MKKCHNSQECKNRQEVTAKNLYEFMKNKGGTVLPEEFKEMFNHLREKGFSRKEVNNVVHRELDMNRIQLGTGLCLKINQESKIPRDKLIQLMKRKHNS